MTASLVWCSFLSCLCGSEGGGRAGVDRHHFLSCLCGSEVVAALSASRQVFLSCLCGSEVLHTNTISLIVKELAYIRS